MFAKYHAACLGLVVTALLSTVANAQTLRIGLIAAEDVVAVQRPLPQGSDPVEASVQALLAGPSSEEATQGLSSYLPAGTKLVTLDQTADSITIDLSDDVLQNFGEYQLQQIFRQFQVTLNQFDHLLTVRLTCREALLSSYLAPAPQIKPGPQEAPPPQVTTAYSLSGRNITIGPSHGRYWVVSNGVSWWGWQRSDPCGFGEAVLEDTNSIRLMQFLYQYLTQDGAVVHVPRQLNESDCCNSDTGMPWWKMCAQSWLHHAGLPCSVWASSSENCGADTAVSRSSDDIRARPLFADYRNSDIYIAHHTNAGGGGTATGTEVYRDTSMEHPAHEGNSYTLALNIKNSIDSSIRELYDGSWTIRNGGQPRDSAGGFGEIRIPDRPACLIELAFHDNCSKDAVYLTDDYFRSVAEWGVYKGICQYFGVTPGWDRYSDEYVSDTLPAIIPAGQTVGATITFRNRGVLWRTAKSFRLGAVNDSDPFTTSTRVNIVGDVKPGSTYTFNLSLTAPATPGSYVTDWRMVRDGFTWFGATVTKTIQVGDPGLFPNITQQPASITRQQGGTANFTIQAEGPGPLTYQWKKNGANLTNGGRFSGVTSNALQITYLETADAGNYTCTVTNPNGNVTSSTAVLTVNAIIFMVESKSGGQNFSKYSETGVWADATGVKSSAAGTTSGIISRYGSTWRAQAGEKHALFDADLPVAGQYEVFATWGTSSLLRNPILHRVTHAAGTTEINVNQSATSNAWVSLGTFAFNGGTNVGRVDMNNLNIDVSGSMYADAMKWEYRGSGIQPPSITQQPTATSACSGGSASFTVSATGGGTLSYQWRINGTDLTDTGPYTGVTTPTLTVSNATAAEAGSYSCFVQNAVGTATSNAVNLTISSGTTITAHPQSRTINAAESTTFTVTATGVGTLTYQWKKNDVDVVNGSHFAGATTATLTVSSASTAEAGEYTCAVTGTCGMTVSNSATLTVIPPTFVPGDTDFDNDVDQEDFGVIQRCLTGVGVAQNEAVCQIAKLDGDSDVDNDDLQIFIWCYTGPGGDGDLECAAH